MSHSSLAFSFDLHLPVPSPDDKISDSERIKRELEKNGICNAVIPLDLLRNIPQKLRENDFSISLVLGRLGEGIVVIDVLKNNIYGIALDIGTTNIEGALFDLNTKRRISQIEIENPQMSYGADVLSRVHSAIAGQTAGLRDSLCSGINELIKKLVVSGGITKDDIYAVTVAGNTIMSHLFLGLDVRNISVTPYVPTFGEPLYLSADEAGIGINRNGILYVFPNAGSYVGGDIISGMLFAEIHRNSKPALFIDVGTNVEIALGCSDWIMVGAGAAGPALEGGVADIGRKVEPGTIYKINMDRATKEITFAVMSDLEPTGICGSGMIDLISEMYSSDVIDQSGRFRKPLKGVIERNGESAYLLYTSGEKELFLTEREIQNFLRSKAGMFAFLYVFLRSADMKFSDIERIYVAGALGCGINLENAVNIGMLPDIQRNKFIPIGNASLSGASKLLLNSDLLSDVQLMRSLILYREMGEDRDLLNILQGAMFIPHTDPEMLKG